MAEGGEWRRLAGDGGAATADRGRKPDGGPGAATHADGEDSFAAAREYATDGVPDARPARAGSGHMGSWAAQPFGIAALERGAVGLRTARGTDGSRFGEHWSIDGHAGTAAFVRQDTDGLAGAHAAVPAADRRW